jgi:hypothetical protein
MDTLFTTNFSDTAKAVTLNSDTIQEIRLSNFNSGRGGRGGRGRGRGTFMCTNCGKQGHTASHRWFAARTSEDAQENASQNDTIPYCDYCGRNGHAEHNCWLKPSSDVEKTAIQELNDEIKEIRAALMAQNSANDYRNETSLYALDVSHKDKECCLTAIGDSLDFTCSMDSLGESYIWIADSGCSAHCTGRLQGMISIISHGENGGDGYVQPDGTESKAIATGDLPVECYDKHGKEAGICRLTGVNYVRGQRFNLFSTTKLQLDGWIPGGNTQALRFSHPETDFVLTVDIKINTGRGCVFGAFFRPCVNPQAGESSC